MSSSVSETATIPAVKRLQMEKMTAAAHSKVEAVMMGTSVTVVIFPRINTPLFSVSLLFVCF